MKPTINIEYNLKSLSKNSFSERWKRGALMKKFAAFWATVLLIGLASTAYSQSLAELAAREQQRRNEISNERVITKEQADKFRTEPETVGSAEDQTAGAEDSKENKAAAETQAQAEKPDPDEPVDFMGRTESFWRETMSEARQKVKNLENEANVLVLKLNSLHNDFYNEDDGFKRETIQREIQKSFYEQDLNKENLAKAKAALRDLENEARKSGALPGWLSGKKP
jgi:hypothetical protein